jgi:predicted nucleic acid-binding protein
VSAVRGPRDPRRSGRERPGLRSACRQPRRAIGGCVHALLDERIEAVGCPALLAEVASVLRRDRLRRYTSSDEARPFVARLAAVMTLAEDPSPAVDALVTGDRDLLEPEDIGVAVITPRELVERLADAG